MSRHRHFMEIVREHCEAVPQSDVCQFLTDTTTMEGPSLTYAQLDERARQIAVLLQQRLQPGDRVLVLHKPGLDYITSLFACFYSAMVVVPVFSPNFGNLNASAARLIGIIHDCSAAAILCSRESLSAIETLLAEQQHTTNIACIASDDVDDIDASVWRAPSVRTQDVSLLQYTSGSTSAPKGVMVSQDNLINNLSIICKAFRMYEPGHLVIWLPPYHDMGLIGGILAPILTKYPLTLMSPLSFIKDPLSWLRIISARRATISGGPNFAYAVCEKALAFYPDMELDLSSWNIAFCGAEPVKAQTVEGFTSTFAPYGFKRNALAVCYGLAEATLMVSTSLLSKKESPIIRQFSRDTLLNDHYASTEHPEDESTKSIVSCGPVITGHDIAVVDTNNCKTVPEGGVGEIWLSGQSIAKGYWGKTDLTQQTFYAELTDDSSKKQWLRTGDYGFVLDEELYITGRIKDLIIVRGQNYYPQDIESLSEALHDALLFCNSAAVVIEGEGESEDKVVLIQEVRGVTDQHELSSIAASIRQRVSQQLALHLAQVVLVPPKTIPKTTSGKVQRSQAKARYCSQQMDILLLSESNDSSIPQPSNRIDVKQFLAEDLAKLVRSSINDYLDARYGSDFHNINAVSLTDLGLDSIRIIELKNHIESVFNIVLDVSTIYQNSELDHLCHYVADEVMKQQLHQQHKRGRAAQDNDRDEIDPGRQAIFYTCLFNPGTNVYTIARAVRLREPLDIEKLCKAVDKLLEVHPNLATVYALDGETIVRRPLVNTSTVLSVETVDELTQQDLADYVCERAHEPLILETGPLVQLIYFKAAKQQDFLLFKFHHIVSDHWSLSRLFGQLSSLYASSDSERTHSTPVVDSEPANDMMSEFYHNYRIGDNIDKDRAFWQQCLANTDFSFGQGDQLPSIRTFCCDIDSDLTESVIGYAKHQHVTPFVVLLTAYQLSVSQLLNKECVITGTPVTLRDNNSIADYMGYCSNLLPIVSRSLSQSDLSGAFAQTVSSINGAMRHKNYYFSQIVADLNVSRDRHYLPVFDTLFVYQSSAQQESEALTALSINADNETINLLGTQAVTLTIPSQQLLSPLCVSVSVLNGKLRCCIEYDSKQFEDQAVRELSERFKTYLMLLEQGSSGMELPEKQRLLREKINQTDKFFENSDLCLDQLFTRQAKRSPDAVAVITAQHFITYACLQQRVETWTHVALKKKHLANELIAIVMDKSVEQVVATLAVMAAGCAYLPIDADFSEQKIKELLELGEVTTVFTQAHYLQKLQGITESYQALDYIEAVDQTPSESVIEPPSVVINTQRSNTDLAYVIFTSGSTGKPKGVMIEHRQVVNTLLDINDRFNVSASDRIFALSNLDFDLSVYDIFGVLAAGGALVLCEKEKYKEPEYWQRMIKQHRITLWNGVPMFMQMLVEYSLHCGDKLLNLHDTLRVIMLSGDWIPLDLPEQIFELFNNKQQVELVAMGGATECSIWSNYFKVERVDPRWRSIPYGKPLANQRYEILDSSLQPCPDGVSGDLYIGGVGVARGYWKDPQRTQKQFIEHPVLAQRLYRTGDRALYWEDGNIEFLGREDDQVKIGGYRIELGDITSRIKSCSLIKEALVTLDRENEKSQLLAYLIPSNNNQTHKQIIDSIRNQLTSQLPRYMWPEHYIVMETFPLSRNGKVDRKALPRPAQSAASRIRKKASGTLQTQLTELWKDVLSLEEVYVNDNFFELGGNSLLVVKLNNLIEKSLNIRLDVNTIVNNQTIELLDSYIKNHYVHREREPIKKRERVLIQGES